MRLSTQLHRSLFALPLLAIGLAAGSQADATCALADAAAAAAAERAGAPLVEVAAGQDCAEALRPVGARVLARVPGDIGELALRMRCAS